MGFAAEKMFCCFLCTLPVAHSVKQLLEHFKTVHGISEPYGRFCCKQGQCSRTFSNKYTFIGHLRREHHNDISDAHEANVAYDNAVRDCTNESHATADILDPADCSEPSAGTDELDVKHLAAMFICEAKSHISTLSSVHSVVQSCKHLFEAIVDSLNDMVTAIEVDNVAEYKQKICDRLSVYRNPFDGLETEYSQTAYIESLGAFVRPETYVIGQTQTFVNDRATGMRKPIMQSVTGQYVSISRTLQSLSTNTNLIEEAVAARTASEDACLRSYFDGAQWKEHPLNNEDVIVLRLYGDDFEPANPLGSRKSVYKVGCIYFQLENLPSYLLSRTENIFLALCFHSADVKEFGWECVLRPLVLELQSLENCGVNLNISGVNKKMRVVVGVFTGDNLFLNSILGFVESFVAAYPCRHCHLPRNQFQHVFVENDDMKRTIASYDKAVLSINTHETGIKQVCALNKLKYFHAATNFVQDVMHDVFEGVMAYDLPLICQRLIAEKFFSLSMMNHRLQTFDYGYYDVTNKPPTISSVNVEMMPFDAAQMWCFCRVLAITVGDLVSEDDTCWHFYLLLRQIVDILVAPVISDGDLHTVRVLISEYLELHQLLFPEQTLKNKHHHLIHYERLMRNVGPLQRFSCMRFESKHQRSKKLLHVGGNFKNVLKSCAFRHQHDVAFRLLQPRDRLSDVVVGTGAVITLSELNDGTEVNSVLGNLGMSFEVYSANWLEVKGVRYKPGCVLVCGLEPDGQAPVFMVVAYIIIRDQCAWFVGEKLEAEVFNVHYHAWTIKQHHPRQMMTVLCSEIQFHAPLTMSRVQFRNDTLLVVSLRHRI